MRRATVSLNSRSFLSYWTDTCFCQTYELPWVASPFYDMQQEPQIAEALPLIGSHLFVSDMLVLRVALPLYDMQQVTEIAKALSLNGRTFPSVLFDKCSDRLLNGNGQS